VFWCVAALENVSLRASSFRRAWGSSRAGMCAASFVLSGLIVVVWICLSSTFDGGDKVQQAHRTHGMPPSRL
jgi:hypothetical protein